MQVTMIALPCKILCLIIVSGVVYLFWPKPHEPSCVVNTSCAVTGLQCIVCLIWLAHAGINELQWGGGVVPNKANFNWSYKT